MPLPLIPIIVGGAISLGAMLIKGCSCGDLPQTEKETEKKSDGGSNVDSKPIDEYIPPPDEKENVPEKTEQAQPDKAPEQNKDTEPIDDKPKDDTPTCLYSGRYYKSSCKEIAGSIDNGKKIQILCSTPSRTEEFPNEEPIENIKTTAQSNIEIKDQNGKSIASARPTGLWELNTKYAIGAYDTDNGSYLCVIDRQKGGCVKQIDMHMRKITTGASNPFIFLTRSLQTYYFNGLFGFTSQMCSEKNISVCSGGIFYLFKMTSPENGLDSDLPHKDRLLLNKGSNPSSIIPFTDSNGIVHLYTLQRGEPQKKPVISLVEVFDPKKSSNPVIKKDIELPNEKFLLTSNSIILSDDKRDVYAATEKGLMIIMFMNSEKPEPKYFDYSTKLASDETIKGIIWSGSNIILTTIKARHLTVSLSSPESPVLTDFVSGKEKITSGPSSRPASSKKIIEFSRCPDDNESAITFNPLQ